MEYVFFFSNSSQSLSYLPFRAKAKAKAKVNTSVEPVRKQSISSNDGQNSILAPQLKIDVNGALVVDEER